MTNNLNNLLEHEQNAAILRDIAVNGTLAEYCIGIDSNYQLEWFHNEIAIQLEKGFKELKEGKDVRLMIFMPPRHGKSDLATQKFPSWVLGQDPTLPIMVASYSDELATDFGQKTRDLMKSPNYQAMFDARLRQDTTAKGKWMTKEGGGYIAVGIGGAQTGRGFKIGIVDDPFKNREEADSPVTRDSRYKWYQSTFSTREEGNSMIIFILTRWHEDDLAGRVLRDAHEAKQKGEPYDEWRVIEYKAIAVNDEIHRNEGEALWPGKFSLEKLLKKKSEMGSYEFCTPKETPILMSDWTTKPISDVKVGDIVVGFERGTQEKRAILKYSKVLDKASIVAPVCDIKLESGRKVRCTENHRWYTGRKEGDGSSLTRVGRKSYAPACLKRGGNRLMFVEEPFDKKLTLEQVKKWNYLAGIIDGEGHIGRSAIFITQTIGKNTPVINKIREVLSALSIDHKETFERTKKNWSDRVTFAIRKPREIYRKLVRYTDIAKKNQITSKLINHSHTFIKNKDRVVSITKGKEETVYSLQTETSNYIAWGYASSNSALYQQSPIDDENRKFKQDWFRYRAFEDLHDKETYNVMTIDPRGKDDVKSGNDYIGITVNFIDNQGKWNILCYRMKLSATQLVDLIFTNWQKFNLHKIGIEDNQFTQGLKISWEEESRLRGVFPYIELLKHGGVQKELRIESLVPRYERGGIYHLTIGGVNQCIELEEELALFPKAPNDDASDSLAFQSQISERPADKVKQRTYQPINLMVG